MKYSKQEEAAARAFLMALADRFKTKIESKEYYLSYSGGRDSHFLYWFIKNWLKDQDIVVVGVNTGMDIPEIRDRILKNSDVVLHPMMHRDDIKAEYGIPCFSKQQDEYIYRYQHGNRSENTMKYINGENPVLNLNKKARKLLLSDSLHPISNKCCTYSKDKPMEKWGKKNGRKAIMGVRGTESRTRKAQYTSCLTATAKFTPLWDWTDEMMELCYKVYDIETPRCYQYLTRTGCAGCPYGRNTETELAMLPRLQQKSAIGYFRDTYDVLGIEYRAIQSLMGYEEN